MKITFLGTGTSQGIPVIGSTHPVCFSRNTKDKRLRSSVLVEKGDWRIVIDCGPDFRMQMLRSGTTKLDAILFTHEHADHTAGLDDIRQFSLRNGDLPIYAHKRVMQNLEKRFDYIFEDKIVYKGKPKVQKNILDGEPFFVGNQKIIPVDLVHGDLQDFGYRIDDFAYLTDLSFIAASSKQLLQNLEVLVVDALRIKPHPTHFNLQQALALVDALKPEKAYFTHISHKLGFHDEVQATLPENVFLAYDGLTVKCCK